MAATRGVAPGLLRACRSRRPRFAAASRPTTRSAGNEPERGRDQRRRSQPRRVKVQHGHGPDPSTSLCRGIVIYLLHCEKGARSAIDRCAKLGRCLMTTPNCAATTLSRTRRAPACSPRSLSSGALPRRPSSPSVWNSIRTASGSISSDSRRRVWCPAYAFRGPAVVQQTPGSWLPTPGPEVGRHAHTGTWRDGWPGRSTHAV